MLAGLGIVIAYFWTGGNWGVWEQRLAGAIAGGAIGWHLGQTLAGMRGQTDLAVWGPIRSVAVVAAANAALIYWLVFGAVAALPDGEPPVLKQREIGARIDLALMRR